MTPRTLIVCADDFAESEAKSEAILELVREKRISAVSCMTGSPLWDAFGARLRREDSQARIGLHFNLTLSFGGPVQRLTTLMTESLLRRIDVTNVRVQLLGQLEAFERVMGRPPDFIDGHEHVHAFPQIAEVVLDVAGGLPGTRVRALGPLFGRTDAPLKRAVIRLMAVLGRRRDRSRAAALALNAAFAGDYSMRAAADFPALCASWIEAAPPGALLMCHPSLNGAGAHEFQFLRSADYLEALRRSGIRLY
jgi:predicted glycoside hydrolase/deacetylase ChbG (UPF0249 family)